MKHARIVLLQSVQQFYYRDILSKIKDKVKANGQQQYNNLASI